MRNPGSRNGHVRLGRFQKKKKKKKVSQESVEDHRLTTQMVEEDIELGCRDRQRSPWLL